MTCLADIRGPLVIYDGHCMLCHAVIRFIIRHDKLEHVKFMSLRDCQDRAIVSPDIFLSDSVLLILDGKLYTYSEAVIRVWMCLGHARMKSTLLLIPAFIRDGLYKFIARKRYQWFGKTDNCPVLPPSRFFS